MTEMDQSDTQQAKGLDFYDLAAKFAEESSTSDRPHRLLKRWAHLFPEHAADLAAIAYARLIDPDSVSEHASVVDEQEILGSVQRVLDRFKTNTLPLTSLVAAANKAGLTPHDLAADLRIDIPLVAKLEQCLLDVSSIPSILIDRLSKIIGSTSSDVFSYLSGPPRLAANAAYKSKKAPSVSDKQSFADALESSRMISAENRDYWREYLDDVHGKG